MKYNPGLLNIQKYKQDMLDKIKYNNYNKNNDNNAQIK